MPWGNKGKDAFLQRQKFLWTSEIHPRPSLSFSLHLFYADVSTRLSFIGIFSAYYRRRDQNWGETSLSDDRRPWTKIQIFNFGILDPSEVRYMRWEPEIFGGGGDRTDFHCVNLINLTGNYFSPFLLVISDRLCS